MTVVKPGLPHMSSALTHGQRDVLLNVAKGMHTRGAPRLSDLQLLRRVGLIIEDDANTGFRITEAGKRYVAFIERAGQSSVLQAQHPAPLPVPQPS
jgi:hypothetical protein